MTAPVVLIMFRRPDETRRVLATIRSAAPSELFVLADGPREGRPDDVERCAATRALVDEMVDWPCTVHRRYAEKNLGLAASVEHGLDWVFTQVDRAIILEDDCLASPSFFRFATELLERHHDDPQIGYVCGFYGFDAAPFGAADYAYASFGPIWGWATWASAWQQHRARFPRDHATGQPSGLPAIPSDWSSSSMATPRGRRFFEGLDRNPAHVATTWAMPWVISNILAGRLAAVPRVNLVENIGFGADGTHTQSNRAPLTAQDLPLTLTHPASVTVNLALSTTHELASSHALGTVARLVASLAPPGSRARRWAGGLAMALLKLRLKLRRART